MLSVGQPARRRNAERQLEDFFRLTAVGADDVECRLPVRAPLRSERDARAVGTPVRVVVTAFGGRQRADSAARRVEQPEVLLGIVLLEIELLHREHEPRAVGREVGRAGTFHGPQILGGDDALRRRGIRGADERNREDQDGRPTERCKQRIARQ